MIGCQSEQHQYNSPQQRHPPAQGKEEVDMYGNLAIHHSSTSVLLAIMHVACYEAEENLHKNTL